MEWAIFCEVVSKESGELAWKCWRVADQPKNLVQRFSFLTVVVCQLYFDRINIYPVISVLTNQWAVESGEQEKSTFIFSRVSFTRRLIPVSFRDWLQMRDKSQKLNFSLIYPYIWWNSHNLYLRWFQIWLVKYWLFPLNSFILLGNYSINTDTKWKSKCI